MKRFQLFLKSNNYEPCGETDTEQKLIAMIKGIHDHFCDAKEIVVRDALVPGYEYPATTWL